jgi:hypothetical protein
MKKVKSSVCVGIFLILGLVVSATSCVTTTARFGLLEDGYNSAKVDEELRQILYNSDGTRNYTVVGAVVVEGEWFGVFGSTTLLSGDQYLYQKGERVYKDLFDAARQQYGETEVDAVIGIDIDFRESLWGLGIYNKRTWSANGYAIKFLAK